MSEGSAQSLADSAGGSISPADAGKAKLPVTRRRFLRFLMSFSIISSIAMIITPIVGFLVPTKTSSGGGGGRVLVAQLDSLPVGSGAVKAVGSKPAIVINTAQGVKAYSAICTHLGCIVAWDPAASAIVCPCHDGRFNPATGAVISGPPPAPLPTLTTAIEGNDIYVVTG